VPGRAVVDPGFYLHLVEMVAPHALGLGVRRQGFSWSACRGRSTKRKWRDGEAPDDMVARKSELATIAIRLTNGGMDHGPSQPAGRTTLYLSELR